MGDENQTPNRYPLGEPSVLDYVKSLLRFGDGERIRIPEFVEEEGQQTAVGDHQPAVSNQLSATEAKVMGSGVVQHRYSGS